MKLSKLASISLTSIATVVFLFGVFASRSLAQGTSATVEGEVTVVLDESDLSLPDPGATTGFGLVVQNWIEDVRARLASNPELVREQAERTLARLSEAAESSDATAAERLEMARARYEEKLAKLEAMSEGLSDEQKEALLGKLAKHEAILENVFERAPEQATAGLQIALQNAAENRRKVLARISEARKDQVLDSLEARRAAIKERLELRSEELVDESQEFKDRIEARRARLEEFRANRAGEDAEVVGDGSGEDKARDRLKDRVEQDWVDLQDQKSDAREAFQQRVLDKKSGADQVRPEKTNRIAPLNSSDIRKVQGAIDYQPQGYWEKFGAWLQSVGL